MKPPVNYSIRRLLYHIAKANAEIKGKPFSQQKQKSDTQRQAPSVKDFTTLLSAVQSLKQDVSTLLKEQSFHDSYDKQIVQATQQEHERLTTLDRRERELETEYHEHDTMLQNAARRLEMLSTQVRDIQNSATKNERENTTKAEAKAISQSKETPHNEVSMKHMHRLKEIMYVEDKLHELEHYYNEMSDSGYSEDRLKPLEERINRFKKKIKELKEKNKIFQ